MRPRAIERSVGIFLAGLLAGLVLAFAGCSEDARVPLNTTTQESR